MRRDTDRLRDMLDAISLIETEGTDVREVFDTSIVIRYFCLKQVEIIGEAVFKLSSELKERHPDVPWDKIERTRHILVHDYFDVDWDILWDILQKHLPSLQAQVVVILQQELE